MAALGVTLSTVNLSPEGFAAVQERAAQAGLELRAAEVDLRSRRDVAVDPALAAAARALGARGGPRLVARDTLSISPWTGPEGKRRAAIQHGRALMAAAAGARLEGVIVRLPGCDQAATAVRRRAIELIPEGAARLFLENPPVPPAAPGHRHFRTPAHIIELLIAVREVVDPTLERVGLCINLAHLLASGADVDTPEKLREWLDEVMRVTALPPDGLIFDLRGTKSPAAAEVLRRAEQYHRVVLVSDDARSLRWLEGLLA